MGIAASPWVRARADREGAATAVSIGKPLSRTCVATSEPVASRDARAAAVPLDGLLLAPQRDADARAPADVEAVGRFTLDGLTKPSDPSLPVPR